MSLCIQETAKWMVWYRYRESQKENPRFIDPLALELFKKNDCDQFSKLRLSKSLYWAFTARTLLIDQYLEAVLNNEKIGVVINLACGYDGRPWRLNLPKNLLWYDLDDEQIIDWKRNYAKEIPPPLNYQLENCGAQNIFYLIEELLKLNFDKKILILTEGFIYYLPKGDVQALFKLISKYPSIFWITDYISPSLSYLMNIMAIKQRPKFQSDYLPIELEQGSLRLLKTEILFFYAYTQQILPLWLKVLGLILKMYPKKLQDRWFSLSGVALLKNKKEF